MLLLYSVNVAKDRSGAFGTRDIICECKDMDKEVIWIAIFFGIFVISMGTVVWMTLFPGENAAPPETPLRKLTPEEADQKRFEMLPSTLREARGLPPKGQRTPPEADDLSP